MMVQDPLRVLKDYFGYDDFRENQLEIIETVLRGEDAFVLMPTGSGKSVCYQIPAMLCRGMGIIISPLIALMEDQVKALQQNGVRAAYLNSTLSFKEAQNIQRKAAAGYLDVLYVAPERLLTPDFQHFLSHVSPGLFAIDEAHCVSQWGHDFRPEYLRIREVTHRFPDTPRMALTATADSVTREDILEKLNLRQAKVFVSSFDRPNIHYHIQVKNKDKHQLLDFIRSNHPEGSGIVYARTRKRTESIAEWLSQRGVDALPYHAGLPKDVRMENQKRFQENRIRVIVATIAFGMGIDKPDVRFVAHVDLPASMEAYYQETGRAGRDGLSADAWMVYSLSDVSALRRLFELSEGSDEFKHVLRRKLEALLGYCESVVCRRKLILNYFGETHDGGCGCCDNCLNPVDTWDGTVAAQKALSCVYRTGERFGAGHLIHVLMGKNTRQVERWHHDRLKTFGVGQDLDKKTWMSVFRQLLSAGLLSVDMGRMSGFRLTEESWKVLKGEKRVSFRKDGHEVSSTVKRHSPKEVDTFSSETDQMVFEALRKLRRDISHYLSVPPYIVFNDRTLKEMAAVKPRDTDEFLMISGVGEIKAERYADIFLACIRGEEVDVAAFLERKEKNTADTAYFTVGKQVDKRSNLEEETETKWKPEPEVAHFVKGKVIELGTIEAINAHYNDDSLISRYARCIAPKLFGMTKGAIESRNKKLNLTNPKEHTDVTHEPEDPFQKSIVCFAVSRKYQGYCVAGKELGKGPPSTWVRPVRANATGELSLKTIQLEDGTTPGFLDIVKIAVKKPLPHYYQAENCLIDGRRRWKKVGRLKPEELVHYCDHVEALWVNGHHSSKGKNDRIPIEVANEQCESSLVLIKPQAFSLILITGLTFKQRIRGEFVYNGETYNLSVTDPMVEKICANWTPGQYEVDERPLYLCISLGEPFEGFCYKLVAGVIGMRE